MISSTANLRLPELGDYLRYVPFDVTRQSLYDARSLYAGYIFGHAETFGESYDQVVYSHYEKTGPEAFSALEAMARALHDYNMSHAVKEFLVGRKPRRTVGVMGGHSLLRTDSMFRTIVTIAKHLTERGFLMVSGGGPGAMEATHLGAWLAGRDDSAIDSALKMLAPAPNFNHADWIDTALSVMQALPRGDYHSLGVPTWLYGHEPATPLATHIAKFFDNSIRENLILTASTGGVIYTPGSAGTMQEIFQDAVQNHYLSYGYASPMAFVGWKFWTKEMPVFPFLEKMQAEGKYRNLLLSISDDAAEVVQVIERAQE